MDMIGWLVAFVILIGIEAATMALSLIHIFSGALYHAPVKCRSDHDRMRGDSYSDACGKHDGASGGEIWIRSGVCVEMSAYQYTVLSDHDSDHDIIYMRVLCAGGTCPALTEAERRLSLIHI